MQQNKREGCTPPARSPPTLIRPHFPASLAAAPHAQARIGPAPQSLPSRCTHTRSPFAFQTSTCCPLNTERRSHTPFHRPCTRQTPIATKQAMQILSTTQSRSYCIFSIRKNTKRVHQVSALPMQWISTQT
jgi:hypothetical protein